MSKYKTGLFFKSCLYSGSPVWKLGFEPQGTGELIAAVCINKAVKEVSVAIDDTKGPRLQLEVYREIDRAFESLEVSKAEQADYEMLFQRPSGTIIMPTFVEEKWFARIKKRLAKRLQFVFTSKS